MLTNLPDLIVNHFKWVGHSRDVMSDSEFHPCLCGGEADGGMEPAR
ncbi:hypothetical protein SAMN05192574_110141 [Mucilaginibacter gossypiicola]|uniref:Uncharacterized protein n=1 Tax=Mucilaginibacter gossypiicola TaxID=551995 RepID=A0A1H8RGE1_9SPHI|nr:hypothetical protein SAMN05192574_110141 [Mucilaginibacter gossypiicola]